METSKDIKGQGAIRAFFGLNITVYNRTVLKNGSCCTVVSQYTKGVASAGTHYRGEAWMNKKG
jgi:hypothetical protein